MSAAAAVAMKPLKIGMFGGGTVGGGVYEILMKRGVPALQRPVEITRICVRDTTKPRDFTIDESKTVWTTDPNSILTDDSIDCIVEVMGGVGLAKTVVMEALQKGKSVITANKALIAAHLEEIHALSKNKPNNTKFAFEAAVCGGIPIIQTLQSCYAGDVVHAVQGICNGTTNFMLCKMESGMDYGAVLKEAQDLGFAEADPTADVEGHDVQAKIAILAKLAFGTTVAVDAIPTTGISSVQAVDFEYASLLDSTIKLVGTARRLPGADGKTLDGPLSVYVSPVMVSKTHLLATARGAGNAVAVTSTNMGTCSFTGPGAGRFPTANSIVADIVRVANDTAAADPFPLVSSLPVDNDYESTFYVRIPFQDGLGIIRQTGELAEKHGVSIHSILQNPITNPAMANFCLTTDKCKLSQVQAFCASVEAASFARGAKPLFMAIIS